MNMSGFTVVGACGTVQVLVAINTGGGTVPPAPTKYTPEQQVTAHVEWG